MGTRLKQTLHQNRYKNKNKEDTANVPHRRQDMQVTMAGNQTQLPSPCGSAKFLFIARKHRLGRCLRS